jgi:hypothetical protein
LFEIHVPALQEHRQNHWADFLKSDMVSHQVEVIRLFLFSVIYTHKIITVLEALMGHVYVPA